MSFLSPDVAVETNIYMFPKGYKYVRENQDIGIDLKGPWVHRRGYTYTGDWLNGMFHGHGTLTSPRGGWEYVGGFERHEMEGLGELIKDSEFKYAGEFKYSRFDGQGVCIHKNGEKYEGEFRAGKREGKGTFMFADGVAQSVLIISGCSRERRVLLSVLQEPGLSGGGAVVGGKS